MSRRLALALAIALALAPALIAPATATVTDVSTYYLHGQVSDQAAKQAALADDTAKGTATFSHIAPVLTDPQVVQTTTGAANQDFVGNPLTAFWSGPFSGTVQGQLALDWYWSGPSSLLSVSVFADPTWASPRGQADKLIGRGVVTVGGAGPTLTHSVVYVNGTVKGELLIQAAAVSLVTGQTLAAYYNSTTTPSSFHFVDAPLPSAPVVTYDTSAKLAFAPATYVSAHFFGAEPQTTIEHHVAASMPGRISSDRIFVDWPLSSRSQTSQLSRSNDGGDSFRLVLDPTCPQRNRPNCLTGGGGDSEDEVNLVTGDLMFLDQEAAVVSEGLASSTDHGDSFPAARQFAISNSGTAVDRQWLAWSDPSFVSVGGHSIIGFLSYHVPAVAEYVVGITDVGAPIPQPVPQITDVGQSGSMRVDNTNGPGRGWIYVPYRNGPYNVASAPVARWQDPTAWKTNLVTTDAPTIFPWLNLDAHGNLYAVWVANGIVYLAVSPIDDPRNDPSKGGRPASYWTSRARVSAPQVGSAVFPEVTAGDAGRIAITYMGSEDCTGVSDNCALEAHWNAYAALITDALALARTGTLSVTTGKVSHRVTHRGSICTSGTTCTGDRSLLDMMDLGVDDAGRVGVVFMDNNNRLAAGDTRTANAKDGPYTMFSKLVAGPSLLAPTGTSSNDISVAIPTGARTDAGGDATWPNTASGTYLPSLDLLSASAFVQDGDVVVQLPLRSTRLAQELADLAAYNKASPLQTAARIQYVALLSTGDDLFHLSFEVNADGSRRAFGGRLDDNDGVQNGTGAIVGARYVTDAAIPVTATVRSDSIVLRAPKSALGMDVGTPLYSVTALATVGPSESDATATIMTNSSRTIDATPPFDVILQPGTPTPASTRLDCADENVITGGGWATLADTRANEGTLCRSVQGQKTGAFMQVTFQGTAIDIVGARGPRGGTFTATIDGGAPVRIDEYRAPVDPTHPDNTGRKDLDFATVAHFDVASGTHTLRIDVTNDTLALDKKRDMVYVDDFVITGGGPVSTEPGQPRDITTTATGTAMAGATVVLSVAVPVGTSLLEAVMETTDGVTEALSDATGTALGAANAAASVAVATVGPIAPGVYAITITNNSATAAPFTVWEVLTESR